MVARVWVFLIQAFLVNRATATVAGYKLGNFTSRRKISDCCRSIVDLWIADRNMCTIGFL
jgi:hypothetical protein